MPQLPHCLHVRLFDYSIIRMFVCLFVFSFFCLQLSAQDSLNIQLLYHWNDTSLVSSEKHQSTYNDVWGVTQKGKEYAIIGSTEGTHIFDVTDPANSHQVVFIAGTVQGPIVVHRDFKAYKGYLYMVCDEGNSTLQIADLRYLPDSAPLVYNSDSLFSRSHNIFIDSVNANLYVCGGGSNQLSIYSLENPERPALLVNCSVDIPLWGSIGYIHDVYVREGIAYCNALLNGLHVVDFSNPKNPKWLGALNFYTQKGLNHSGWLNEQGNIYYFADETHGKELKICDVTNLSDITVLSTIGSKVDSQSIPHNLIIKDNFLYVSYYHDGLYVFDISDPSHPLVAGFYDTSTEPHIGYRGAWGVYPLLPSGIVLISDMQNGLFIFDVSSIINNVEEINNKTKIAVYPNPFTNSISVSIHTLFSEKAEYEIYDLNGKSIQKSNINSPSFTLHLPDIQKGIYLLKIQTNTNTYLKKIVYLK